MTLMISTFFKISLRNIEVRGILPIAIKENSYHLL